MKIIIKLLPNIVTATRLLTAILAPILFLLGFFEIALVLFIYGAGSDLIDGFLARKLDAISDIGKKMDGFADKIYSLGLLLSSLINGNILVILPMLLEYRISVTNILSNKFGYDVYTEKIGKIKTVFLFPTLLLGLYATIKAKLYYIEIPLLVITTIFQIKTIKSYEKQFQNNINKRGR